MVFSREGMGLILSSLIFAGLDYRPFFEKAIRDGNKIDIQPILKFLDSGDGAKRMETVKLLVDIGDKNAINPLLMHLRRETAPEIKEILIKGIGRTGKKKAIHAIVQVLRETGERDLRLETIRLCHSFLRKDDVSALLLDIREKEEDPLILKELDNLLSTRET